MYKESLNLMVVFPRGEAFICVVDSCGLIKCKSYIVDVITSMIEDVGAKICCPYYHGQCKEF